MDFKRIEIIFLCAFFSLNLFLFFTYQQRNLVDKPGSDINTVATIESRLHADKISFEDDFSRETQQGYYLSAESTDLSTVELAPGDKIEHKQLFHRFQVPPEITFNQDSAEKDLLLFLKWGNGIHAYKDYTYLNKIVSDETKYVMTQEFEGLPFNDETSELVLEVNNIDQDKATVLGYTQAHLGEIDPLREAQDIITEADAIETLYMSNKIPNEGKIIKTQLAYTRLFTVREKNVYIPAWFVWLENNKNNIQLERVNGFSNSVISASVPEVKK